MDKLFHMQVEIRLVHLSAKVIDPTYGERRSNTRPLIQVMSSNIETKEVLST